MRRRISAISLAAAAMVLLPTRAAFAADAACTTPDQPQSPDMATHKLPPYPSLAQQIGEQGLTMLVVTIGTNGTITDAEIPVSSGWNSLDAGAVDFIMANWRWHPAIKNCKPVSTKTEVAVNWHLPSLPARVNPTPLVDDHPPDPHLRPGVSLCAPAPIPSLHAHASFPADWERKISLVVLNVNLADDGAPVEVTIAVSSKNADIDKATMAWIKKSWHWQPPRAGCSALQLAYEWDPREPADVFLWSPPELDHPYNADEVTKTLQSMRH